MPKERLLFEMPEDPVNSDLPDNQGVEFQSVEVPNHKTQKKSVMTESMDESASSPPTTKPLPKKDRPKNSALARKAGSKAVTRTKKSDAEESKDDTRTRKTRPYPDAPFKETMQLGEAIVTFAGGEKVRRLTLLSKMDRQPARHLQDL